MDPKHSELDALNDIRKILTECAGCLRILTSIAQRAKRAEHIQNMPLGTPSCDCDECVTFRARRENPEIGVPYKDSAT